MAKWADYLISAVSYDSKHRISIARQHKDTGGSITDGEIVDKNTIASNISNGNSYITIFSTNSTWKKGQKINSYRIGGDYFIRIDQNKVNLDNLGQIQELQIPKESIKSPELKQPALSENKNTIEKTQTLAKQKTQIVTSPRGSLPKQSITTEDEEATPEQIARLEELERKLAQFEKPKEVKQEQPQIKESSNKFDIEIDKQISRLNEIEKRVQNIDPDHDIANEKLIEDSDLSEYYDKLSGLSKQIQELEKTLHMIQKPKETIPETKSVIAYCVKCKQKREIKNTIQTTMKNNRPAIRGICSSCGTKVFRIG